MGTQLHAPSGVLHPHGHDSATIMESSSDLSPKTMCLKAFPQGCQHTELLISVSTQLLHQRDQFNAGKSSRNPTQQKILLM